MPGGTCAARGLFLTNEYTGGILVEVMGSGILELLKEIDKYKV